MIPQLAARVRALREHGQYRKYHHDEIGWTARLDTIQAAVLSRKLPLLDGWNDERRADRRRCTSTASQDVGDLVLPPVAAGKLARVAPVRDPDAEPTRAGASHLQARRDRHRAPLPGAAAPESRLCRRSGTPEGSVPGRRGHRAGVPLAPDLPGHDRVAGAPGRRVGRPPGSTVADGPANDAPFRLFRDVTFGDGVTVYSFANLYGCSIGDDTRVGSVRRDPARRRHRRALQDPEPHVHLRRRHHRGRGVRRATA